MGEQGEADLRGPVGHRAVTRAQQVGVGRAARLCAYRDLAAAAPLGTNTVYGTREQTEAVMPGDCVCVLRNGVIRQVASPYKVYEQPVNLFGHPRVHQPSQC